jgi:hypothetical protein
MKAFAQNATEYSSWNREVVIEIGDETYYGVLSYSDWDGYDWDGDEIPGVRMNQDWYYELDGMTCDKDGCFACAQNKKNADGGL